MQTWSWRIGPYLRHHQGGCRRRTWIRYQAGDTGFKRGKNIERVVEDLVRGFPQLDYVVVNDCSRDCTAESAGKGI